jgi:hypothetical protein
MKKLKVKSSKLKVNKNRIFLLLDPGTEDGPPRLGEAGRLRFFVLDAMGEVVVHHAFEADRKAIEFMLAEIEKKLREIERGLHDIKGIMVARGGESFSAVRGVHAIANALAWSLGVPSVAVIESKSQKVIMNQLKLLKRKSGFRLLLPTYSRPPNITMPK